MRTNWSKCERNAGNTRGEGEGESNFQVGCVSARLIVKTQSMVRSTWRWRFDGQWYRPTSKCTFAPTTAGEPHRITSPTPLRPTIRDTGTPASLACWRLPFLPKSTVCPWEWAWRRLAARLTTFDTAGHLFSWHLVGRLIYLFLFLFFVFTCGRDHFRGNSKLFQPRPH